MKTRLTEKLESDECSTTELARANLSHIGSSSGLDGASGNSHDSFGHSPIFPIPRESLDPSANKNDNHAGFDDDLSTESVTSHTCEEDASEKCWNRSRRESVSLSRLTNVFAIISSPCWYGRREPHTRKRAQQARRRF